MASGQQLPRDDGGNGGNFDPPDPPLNDNGGGNNQTPTPTTTPQPTQPSNTQVLADLYKATIGANNGMSSGQDNTATLVVPSEGSDSTVGLIAIVLLVVVGGGAFYFWRKKHHVAV